MTAIGKEPSTYRKSAYVFYFNFRYFTWMSKSMRFDLFLPWFAKSATFEVLRWFYLIFYQTADYVLNFDFFPSDHVQLVVATLLGLCYFILDESTRVPLQALKYTYRLSSQSISCSKHRLTKFDLQLQVVHWHPC